MSAVHAAMTAIALTRMEIEDDLDEETAKQKLERVTRGFEYLVDLLAKVGLECIENHDQPICGNCGRPVKG